MTSDQRYQNMCSALTLELEDVDFSQVSLKDIQAHVDLRTQQIARGVFFQHLARALDENPDVQGVWIQPRYPMNKFVRTTEEPDQWDKLRRKPGTQERAFAQSIKPMLTEIGNYECRSIILNEFARTNGRRNSFFVSREDILCSWRYLVNKPELGRTATQVKIDTHALMLSQNTAPAPTASRRSPRL